MSLLVAPGTVGDTTTDPRWTPVRVTARLAEPVVGVDGHRLHLDGPLSWGAYLAGQHAGVILPPTRQEWVHDHVLPLATWTAPCTRPDPDPRLLAADRNSVWGWACSAARYTPDGHTAVQTRRRPAVEQMARYTGDRRHHQSTGPLKARDVTAPATLVSTIVWWALADPDLLRGMLARVHGVGRMPRHGHGRVAAWTVDVDDDAATRWRHRVMPDPGAATDSIRAPYWHRSRHMPAAVPC